MTRFWAAFARLRPGIRIPMLDEKQLADVYLRLKLDEPLLFYVTGLPLPVDDRRGAYGASAGVSV